MIQWQYITFGVFMLAGGGVIGWYVALRRKFTDGENDQSRLTLMIKAVGALLVMLAIGSILQMGYYQREQAIQADRLEKTTDCQYRVNKLLIEVLTKRQDPTQAKDEALLTMVKAVLQAKSTEDTRLALNNYINAYNNLAKTRAENPYPAIPNDCRPS